VGTLLFEHHEIDEQRHQNNHHKSKPEPQGRNGFHEVPLFNSINNRGQARLFASQRTSGLSFQKQPGLMTSIFTE
jgi:hypothetical protein